MPVAASLPSDPPTRRTGPPGRTITGTSRSRRNIARMTDGSARGGRKATATSNFGVSRRENHDASDFYARFSPPTLSADATVNQLGADDVDWIHHGDARAMDDRLKDNSVALVVT